MDKIKRLFFEAWSLGEQNADNSHGGFGFWWDRNKSIIEHELKQLHKPVVGGPASASGSEGEQLGNEAGDTATCGVDDNGWNCKMTTEKGGVAAQCMNGCIARNSCEG